MDPWRVDLIVVRDGSFTGAERRSLTRDEERGRFVQVRPGVHVRSAEWEALDDAAKHVVRMRALVARSDRPIVFSHWSAAVVHRLPFLGDRLGRVHVTVATQEQRGSRIGVAAHVFPLVASEVVAIGDLLVTAPARTVIDVAGASPFDHGVVTADAALRAHLPRELLDAAVDLAAGRHSAARISDVADFAHPGRESAAESETGVTMFRSGIEPPVLQQHFRDRRGYVGRTDTWFPRVRGIGEVDGAQKYLDPQWNRTGAGQVLHDEKKREDRLRALADGLARWGWAESVNRRLLLPILATIGVQPLLARPTLADWAAVARAARPTRLSDPGRVLLSG